MGIKANYKDDQVLCPIFLALKGDLPEDEIHRKRVGAFALFCYGRGFDDVSREDLCPTPKRMRHHTTSIWQRLWSLIVLQERSPFESFHWRNNAKHVESYLQGSMPRQVSKDWTTHPWRDHQPQEFTKRRWGSVSMDFLNHLPTNSNGHECITTFTDR